MFLSMTGFGRASRDFAWGTVTFELTSVNHRYQDFSARLPRELSSLESRFLSSLRGIIKRGKVRLSADIAWTPGARTPSLDEEGLMLIFGRVREVAASHGLPEPTDLTPFVALPGICETSRVSDDAERDTAAWDELLNEAAGSLIDMKKAEGAKLRCVIDSDLNAFEGIAAQLAERWKVARDDAIEALRARIEKVMEHFELAVDDARIAQEITLMSDKWDVAEELARLDAHIARFRQTMDAGDTAGRRLDFLIQEMNREVNTMGSKVNDAEFRWNVVEAKSCLERIREQIQNVE